MDGWTDGSTEWTESVGGCVGTHAALWGLPWVAQVALSYLYHRMFPLYRAMTPTNLFPCTCRLAYQMLRTTYMHMHICMHMHMHMHMHIARAKPDFTYVPTLCLWAPQTPPARRCAVRAA